uniref:Peptidase M16 N-terminal domain-containing protein n=1 Tax=Meloidogyne enterolobii TaxID=390850 RepID=A0A6V7WCI8_MELEN|nr:unnamed protein product [Meloidogyne enterolobii]
MWTKITSFELYRNNVYIFKSNKSRLTLALSNCHGPITKANFNFATEAEDDTGVPHMLEHCIFLGSMLYNGKGLLDIASNLNYVIDTNAATSQDNTSYSFECSNFDGFLRIFNMYLDHLMAPFFEPNIYNTEVHAVDGEGIDIGVLYSEMSGKEKNIYRILNRRTKKLLYGNNSYYSYNTGGMMNLIRSNNNFEKMKNFHKRFYHLDNLVGS